jgi:hypothetical protein
LCHLHELHRPSPTVGEHRLSLGCPNEAVMIRTTSRITNLLGHEVGIVRNLG